MEDHTRYCFIYSSFRVKLFMPQTSSSTKKSVHPPGETARISLRKQLFDVLGSISKLIDEEIRKKWSESLEEELLKSTGTAGSKEYREQSRKLIAALRKKGEKYLEAAKEAGLSFEDVIKIEATIKEELPAIPKPVVVKSIIKASADTSNIEDITQSNDINKEELQSNTSLSDLNDIKNSEVKEKSKGIEEQKDEYNINKGVLIKDVEYKDKTMKDINDSIAQLLQEEQELLSQSVLSDNSEEEQPPPNFFIENGSHISPLESEVVGKSGSISDSVGKPLIPQITDFMSEVHYSENESVLSGVSRRSNVESLQNACQRKREELESYKQKLTAAETELTQCILKFYYRYTKG